MTVADKSTLVSASILIHSRILLNQLAISGQLPTFNATKSYRAQINDLIVTIGAEQYQITVRDASNSAASQSLKVSVTQLADKKSKDGASAAAAPAPSNARLDKPIEIDISSTYQKGDQLFEAVVNGSKHVVQVVEAGDGSSVYTMQYRGTQFAVDVRSAAEHKLLTHMPAKVVLDTSRFVVSPMPGAVFSINVSAGDKVVPGQEVCVVEAMKMQNALRAARAGVVKAVKVKKGQTVQADDVLIEFE